MNRYTVAVLVSNQFGVLNRVVSMFRRRQFNINALTVSETESSELSRITVVFGGEEGIKQQLINQLDFFLKYEGIIKRIINNSFQNGSK